MKKQPKNNFYTRKIAFKKMTRLALISWYTLIFLLTLVVLEKLGFGIPTPFFKLANSVAFIIIGITVFAGNWLGLKTGYLPFYFEACRKEKYPFTFPLLGYLGIFLGILLIVLGIYTLYEYKGF